MPCSNVLNGWIGEGGKLVFNKAHSKSGIPRTVPCGQCWSCRLQKSRDWAVRLVKEASYWPEDKRLFITLTYNPENLPEYGLLSKPVLDENGKQIKQSHFQGFMKNLRDHFKYPKLKYFHCGEYGDQLGRPHYHAIIFGIKFDDMEEFKRTKARELIYKSKTLENIWGKGFCSIGQVTFESCAYVARYIMKKRTGEQADAHYTKIIDLDEETGEIKKTVKVPPEYITMSRNPAIAKEYYDDYHTDIFPHDRVVIKRGDKPIVSKPPRYFLKQLEKADPDMYNQVKAKRKEESKKHSEDQTPERSWAIEQVKKAQTKNLERHFESHHD